MNTHAPVRLMVDGFVEALTRLLAELQRGDAGPDDTFKPMFEALKTASRPWFQHMASTKRLYNPVNVP